MVEPATVLERITAAVNDHDLDALVSCFSSGYRSEQPAHPQRHFVGAEQVRKNWGTLLREIPDLRVDVLRTATAGDQIWAEWVWNGTRPDGSPFDERGVTIFSVVDDHVAWGRLYLEDVEADGGPGIDETVQRMVGRS